MHRRRKSLSKQYKHHHYPSPHRAIGVFMAFLHFFTSGPNHTTRRKLTTSYFSFVQPWIRPLPCSFPCALFIGGIPFGALNPCIYRLRQFDISFLSSLLYMFTGRHLSSDEPDRINGSVSRLSHIFISSLHGTGRVAGNITRTSLGAPLFVYLLLKSVVYPITRTVSLLTTPPFKKHLLEVC